MSAPADNTVGWFEIGTPDVDAAKAFYGQLFGWSFAPDGAYTHATAPGAAGPSGGIFNTGGNLAPYAVFVVQVADVAATASRDRGPGRQGRRRARRPAGRHGRGLPHRPGWQHVRPVQPQAAKLNPSPLSRYRRLLPGRGTSLARRGPNPTVASCCTSARPVQGPTRRS